MWMFQVVMVMIPETMAPSRTEALTSRMKRNDFMVGQPDGQKLRHAKPESNENPTLVTGQFVRVRQDRVRGTRFL